MATSTRPGDLLAGRYRLIDLLSESGGGRFWRAHDRVLERFVALHVIAETDPRAEGLLAAARESAKVLDPRILRVLDAEARDGLCFVVNEWGNGTSLDILVAQAGPLGPRRAAWLTADVAGAIAKAHAVGVAHGRLNPENVLIDRFGAVRLIGLCVDAALHGLPGGRIPTDRADLSGILYCALTATWPGPSTSAVAPAPRNHGVVLPPRRVRAGVPRPLDDLWSTINDERHHPRRRRNGHDPASVADIGEELLAFLGDPTGLPAALAASIPPINEIRPVWLPSVDDPRPHTATTVERPEADAAAAGAEPGADPDGNPDSDSDPEATVLEPAAPDVDTDPEPTLVAVEPPIPTVPPLTDIPTEAGVPVFDDDDEEGGGDVGWFRARSNPPPPPPPFEDPPERPLFAPEPPGGSPHRRPRLDEQPVVPPNVVPPPLPMGRDGYWPWDPDTDSHPTIDGANGGDGVVPGRSWLRLAMVIAAALLVLVAVVVAFNLGRGRTPLGQERDDPSPSPTVSGSPSDSGATPEVVALTGLVATDLDPFGDPPEENSGDTALAVDGDPGTAWATSTYDDQFGPAGLKPGVGLVVDLGGSRRVTEVEVTVEGAPTALALYLSEDQPTEAPEGSPIAEGTAGDTPGEGGATLTLEPESADAEGRYLLVWITSLPEVSDGFRAAVAEVGVRGE